MKNRTKFLRLFLCLGLWFPLLLSGTPNTFYSKKTNDSTTLTRLEMEQKIGRKLTFKERISFWYFKKKTRNRPLEVGAVAAIAIGVLIIGLLSLLGISIARRDGKLSINNFTLYSLMAVLAGGLFYLFYKNAETTSKKPTKRWNHKKKNPLEYRHFQDY